MIKKFNEAGVCFPEDHFMADISQKVAATYLMVEEGAYFIINRPRQYGKTTMLYTIADKLIQSGEYVVLSTEIYSKSMEIYCKSKKIYCTET